MQHLRMWQSDIHDEIRRAIEVTGAVEDADKEYDVEAIARAAYNMEPDGTFVQAVSIEKFWEIVFQNERTLEPHPNLGMNSTEGAS